MNTKFLSLLAGAAILGSVSVATAAEPVPLTDVQMNAVTAGNPCSGSILSSCSITQVALIEQSNKNRTSQSAGLLGSNTNTTGQINYATITQTATMGDQ